MKRVQFIHGLRGFSLLGILLANMLIFQYGMMGKDNIQSFSLYTGDSVTYKIIKVAVEGSFMPIFMFLFGYSLVKLQEKLIKQGGKVKRHLFRRSLMLIVFGFLHAFLLFEGDILLSYGALGLFMMLFLKRSKKTLLAWATVLLLAMSLMSYGGEVDMYDRDKLGPYLEKAQQVYGYGEFMEIVDFRMNEEAPLALSGAEWLIVFFLAPLFIFPMFLFGLYAAKAAWFTNLDAHRKHYRITATLFVPLGWLFKSLPSIVPDNPWSSVASSLGAPLLAFGYIFALALLYTEKNRAVLRLFEQVGRLSMTNYLMQSVICSTIFYGYGLGAFGKLGVLNGSLLAIAIYGLQVVGSHFYLKKFQSGPFERVLRWGVYLKWRATKSPHQVVKSA